MDRYTVFDLEMPNRDGNRISAIGICVIENGQITEHYYSLVDPQCKFDKFTIKITGITPELVKGEPTFPDVWEEVKELFEDSIIVAHSVQGDMYVLSRCLQSYGILWKPVVECACTLELGNICYPDFQSHKLDAMCEALDIELDHHNAGSDAEGAAKLLLDYMEHGIDPLEHIVVYDTIKAHAAHKAKKPFPVKVEGMIKEELLGMCDEECRLIKLAELYEMPENEIIGVPVSQVKQYAENLYHTAYATEFMRLLPHDYLEENDLHACFINIKRKYTTAAELTKQFLPYINNAETCDLLMPTAFKGRPPELMKLIDEWLASFRPYTVRFALTLLMKNYLKDGFRPEYLTKAADTAGEFKECDDILPDFFASALYVQYNYTLPFFEEKRLPSEIHNKAICKYLAKEKAPADRKMTARRLIVNEEHRNNN